MCFALTLLLNTFPVSVFADEPGKEDAFVKAITHYCGAAQQPWVNSCIICADDPVCSVFPTPALGGHTFFHISDLFFHHYLHSHLCVWPNPNCLSSSRPTTYLKVISLLSTSSWLYQYPLVAVSYNLGEKILWTLLFFWILTDTRWATNEVASFLTLFPPTAPHFWKTVPPITPSPILHTHGDLDLGMHVWKTQMYIWT